ncbi:MAG: hypothetical protein CL868_12555 [Cytophagaceae bacterium]|nr:hypothetical protein [Cytophagaceae bacterium]|tara:strand:- start:277 stop:492 length:216 start_codon:yes stop_codon:yes gene_type:complete
MKKLMYSAFALFFAVSITACRETTTEKAADDMEDAIDDAGDAIEDAVDDAGDAIDNAAQDVEDEVDGDDDM